MSKPTGIQWTDRSSNPVRYRTADGRDVWACEKVSAGCRGCYAEALALRFDKGKAFNAGNMAGLTPYLSPSEVNALLSAKKTPPGSRVFVCDMTDAFGAWVPFDLLDRLFAVFALRPDVVFQLLTKRPGRMAEWAARGMPGRIIDRVILDHPARALFSTADDWRAWGERNWPLPNVWLGTSVEDQKAADERIPELLNVPAAVRFLSCEPLLGPVNLRRFLPNLHTGFPRGPRVGWVIVGGESGPTARPFALEWGRDLRDQCEAAGVPFFFKQMGDRVANHDGLQNVRFRHKGGELADIPEDLRVREFPDGVTAPPVPSG